MRVQLMAAAIAVAGVTMSAPTTMAAAPSPTGKLFVEGDSLTVGSSSAIKSALRADFRRITVDAQVGRNTPTGISRLPAGRRANAWVVALGTNDGPDPRTMRRHVRTVLKRAGDRPVLWVSVWRSSAYGKVNRMLSKLDKKRTQLAVLRWDRFIRKHPRLLASDRIHLTPGGYQVRGRMIAEALRGLMVENGVGSAVR